MVAIRTTGLASVLVIVASVACGASDTTEEEPSFDYGRDEMKAAVEGTWEGTSAAGGAESTVTLTLTYVTPDARTLCSNRVLSVSPRCADMSSINVTGTLTSRDPSTDTPREHAFRGTFFVPSLRWSGAGELEGDLDGSRLTARLDGGALEGTIVDGAGTTSKLTLRRK